MLVGPTLLLWILGYHHAAGAVLMCTIGVIIYIVRPPFHQQTPWEEQDEQVIELGLKEQPKTVNPPGAASVLKTNFKR